jgi:hypothetical protein
MASSAKQWLTEHVPVAINTNTTAEELLEVKKKGKDIPITGHGGP